MAFYREMAAMMGKKFDKLADEQEQRQGAKGAGASAAQAPAGARPGVSGALAQPAAEPRQSKAAAPAPAKQEKTAAKGKPTAAPRIPGGFLLSKVRPDWLVCVPSQWARSLLVCLSRPLTRALRLLFAIAGGQAEIASKGHASTAENHRERRRRKPRHGSGGVRQGGGGGGRGASAPRAREQGDQAGDGSFFRAAVRHLR